MINLTILFYACRDISFDNFLILFALAGSKFHTTSPHEWLSCDDKWFFYKLFVLVANFNYISSVNSFENLLRKQPEPDIEAIQLCEERNLKRDYDQTEKMASTFAFFCLSILLNVNIKRDSVTWHYSDSHHLHKINFAIIQNVNASLKLYSLRRVFFVFSE